MQFIQAASLLAFLTGASLANPIESAEKRYVTHNGPAVSADTIQGPKDSLHHTTPSLLTWLCYLVFAIPFGSLD